MTVLLYKSYHPVPSEFHLFQPIKNEQGSQYCPDNDTIIAIGEKWVIFAGTYFNKHVILALVHCWQKFKARSNDDVREKLFCSWKFFLSNAAVVVSMEINRMHYFWGISQKVKEKIKFTFLFLLKYQHAWLVNLVFSSIQPFCF